MGQSTANSSQPLPQTISIQPSLLPIAVISKTYGAVLSVSGGQAPYRFAVVGGKLPPGLSLAADTGSISGVPKIAGEFEFAISVVSDSPSASGLHSYKVGVEACGKCVTVEVSPASVTAIPGASQQFSAIVRNTSNTAVTWSSSAGSITADGLLTVPTNSSLKTVTVAATSVAQPTAGSVATVLLAGTGLTIANAGLPSVSIGTPYEAQLAGSGGVPPYHWNLLSGTLPTGLQFASSSGAITGSASQAGSFPLTVQLADSAAQTVQQTFTLVASNQGTCGPPTYNCSRADLAVVPLPSPLPKVGNLVGVNTVVVDPDFHNPIVRVTDANTHPLFKNFTYMTSSGGSSNANTWNTDSTMIFVQNTWATGFPMTFDAATMQVARMYVSSFPASGGMTVPLNHFSWSRVNPHYLYVVAGTKILYYNFSSTTVPPSPQLLYDFTSSPNCLPAGFTARWQDFGGVSEGDSAFTVAFSTSGFQGTGIYAAIYTVGKGCTVVNTQTGEIKSDWGQTGQMSTPDRFTLHDAYMAKNGEWAILGSTSCLSTACGSGPYFWRLGTTEITACSPIGVHHLCGGHWTTGYTHWANNDGDPKIGQYHFRTYDDLGVYTPIVADLPTSLFAPLDQHPSWNNADASDSVPFVTSTYTISTPVTTPWQNEILAISPTTGSVKRIAHTFITARSQIFDDEEAIGQVSQDGRFFMFSSDWMGTLGSDSGSSSCTIGLDCRGDVFVVKLN